MCCGLCVLTGKNASDWLVLFFMPSWVSNDNSDSNDRYKLVLRVVSGTVQSMHFYIMTMKKKPDLNDLNLKDSVIKWKLGFFKEHYSLNICGHISWHHQNEWMFWVQFSNKFWLLVLFSVRIWMLKLKHQGYGLFSTVLLHVQWKWDFQAAQKGVIETTTSCCATLKQEQHCYSILYPQVYEGFSA